jgi:hypothetical protein
VIVAGAKEARTPAVRGSCGSPSRVSRGYVSARAAAKLHPCHGPT